MWHPRATFTAVVAAPQWAGMLAALTAAAALAAALVFQTEVGRLALVDQWERTAIAFGQPLDDARFAGLVRLSERGGTYGVAMALVNGPLLACAVAIGVMAVFRVRAQRPAPREVGGLAPSKVEGPSFRQVLAVVVHAGVILALRQIAAAPIIYARETTASATSIGVWFPTLDAGSPIARFLGVFDLFVIWWIAVLAIGVAVLYRRQARRLVAVFIALYVGIAAVLTTAMAVLGGTS